MSIFTYMRMHMYLKINGQSREYDWEHTEIYKWKVAKETVIYCIKLLI